jgi:hypothetical protein
MHFRQYFVDKQIHLQRTREDFDAAVTDSRLQREELERWLEVHRDPHQDFHKDFPTFHRF